MFELSSFFVVPQYAQELLVIGMSFRHFVVLLGPVFLSLFLFAYKTDLFFNFHLWRSIYLWEYYLRRINVWYLLFLLVQFGLLIEYVLIETFHFYFWHFLLHLRIKHANQLKYVLLDILNGMISLHVFFYQFIGVNAEPEILKISYLSIAWMSLS